MAGLSYCTVRPCGGRWEAVERVPRRGTATTDGGAVRQSGPGVPPWTQAAGPPESPGPAASRPRAGGTATPPGGAGEPGSLGAGSARPPQCGTSRCSGAPLFRPGWRGPRPARRLGPLPAYVVQGGFDGVRVAYCNAGPAGRSRRPLAVGARSGARPAGWRAWRRGRCERGGKDTHRILVLRLRRHRPSPRSPRPPSTTWSPLPRPGAPAPTPEPPRARSGVRGLGWGTLRGAAARICPVLCESNSPFVGL
ncbi:hypothetical protein SAMN05428944_7918 [Streptomyces sp. 1222.5]|nr:hypothetical protein BX260_7927 [Streptomyces sp. 5112.2]SED84315.1 hypothetical protein SAMN05428944_7918 [Streptomyces sp. 1222.5]